MKLSIVIGTYNRLSQLRNCIKSIFKETTTEIKVYITDAGSTDGTVEYLKSVASAEIIPILAGEKLGQAKACNDVFKIVDTPYVCWLSDDNVIVNKGLDTALRILDKNPGVGMVGLKVKDVAGPFAEAEYLGGVWSSGVLNCNQGMLPTAVLREVGGFDEKFRDYGVDADLTTKVLLSGYKVVYTKVVVIHHFRDHETASWIDKEGRKQRLQVARDYYRHKYEQLIMSDAGGQYEKFKYLTSRKMQLMQDFYAGEWIAFAKKLRMPDDRWQYRKAGYLKSRKMQDPYSGKWGVFMKTRMGLGIRDWHNVFLGRFISDWDLIKNSLRNFYLVQHIPEELRVKVQARED